jgi:hypothetical protein
MTVQSVAVRLPRDPRRARNVAAVLVVDALIVGWVLFAHSGRASDDAVYSVSSLLWLLAVGAIVAAGVVLLRPGPARLVVCQDRLVAPPARMPLVFASVVVLGTALSVASPHTGFWSRGPVLWAVGLGAVVIWLTLQLAYAVFGGGSIELDPSQVRLVYPLGSVAVPWDAVSGELDALGPGGRRLRVTAAEDVTRRGLVGRAGRQAPYLPPVTSINRTFLAAVINYYVTHPEHRQQIGTQAGYDRLLGDVGR